MIDISGHLRNIRRESGFLDDEKYISVNCCGYQKFVTRDFTVIREKGRLDYQIIYIVKGIGIYTINGETITVPEGNLIVFKPGQAQVYEYHHIHSPEAYWVHFTGHHSQQLIEQVGLGEGQVHFIGQSTECIELYKKMMHELQIKRSSYEQFVTSYFLQLLACISRTKSELQSNKMHITNVNIQKAIEAMHSQYSKEHSVKDYARISNLSVYRFIHKFNEYTGLSPMEYLMRIRIDKAKEYLTGSSLNIKEISSIVGYENPLYFSRVFKKKAGVSPSEYRKAEFIVTEQQVD